MPAIAETPADGEQVPVSITVTEVAGDKGFDPLSSAFAPGMELRIGANNYTIEYIKGINANADQEEGLTDTFSSADPPIMLPWLVGGRGGAEVDAQAASAVFDIVVPALRRGPVPVEIVTTDAGTLAAEGDLSAGLTLRAKSLLPEYTIVG